MSGGRHERNNQHGVLILHCMHSFSDRFWESGQLVPGSPEVIAAEEKVGCKQGETWTDPLLLAPPSSDAKQLRRTPHEIVRNGLTEA